MKKIPESFELNEEDIKEAITDWLNNHKDYADPVLDFEFKITLKSEECRQPPSGYPTVMKEDVVTTTFSAIAVKEE
jgi:hypothetical protein